MEEQVSELVRRTGRVRAGRRGFLRGAAAAGVGGAVALLWDPARFAGTRPAAAAGIAQSGHEDGSGPAAEMVAVWTAGQAGLGRAAGSALPTDVVIDDRAKIAHLLRRAGFGATQADLATYVPLGVPGTVDALLGYGSTPDAGLARATAAGLDLTKLTNARRFWLMRMIYTDRPLQEKMTLFLHGILTSGISKVDRLPAMLTQNELLRSNALGAYDALLKSISRDPAMMFWLDLQTSTKAHPNENFARELMELFSIGIGHYTETDVKESARAFTGYQLEKWQYVFNPKYHDDGSKTFMGKTGNFGGDDIIDIIESQQTASDYIAGRLWKFFGSPAPKASVIGAVSSAYKSNGHSLKAALNALFTHPDFYGADVLQAQIKSPTEFVVSASRGLWLDTTCDGYHDAMNQMGQNLFDPTNVSGWPGGAAWISSATFFARANFINRLVYAGRPGTDAAPIDPYAILGDYRAAKAADVIATAGLRLLSMQLSDGTTKVLLDYVTDASGNAAVTDKNVYNLIYLVLVSPESMLN